MMNWRPFQKALPERQPAEEVPMGNFDWKELQRLDGDITAKRFQLTAARSANDQRLIRSLEQEITASEERRAQLVAHLTSNLADSADGAPTAPETPPPAVDQDADAESHVVASETAESNAAADESAPPPPAPDATAEPPDNGRAALRGEGQRQHGAEGDVPLWQRLTPADIERAKAELALRRAEMLARHADELDALEADLEQLEALEFAIVDFLNKFDTGPLAARGSDHVAANSDHLDDQPELRLLAGG